MQVYGHVQSHFTPNIITITVIIIYTSILRMSGCSVKVDQLRRLSILAKAQAPRALCDISLRSCDVWATEISSGGRPGRFFDS